MNEALKSLIAGLRTSKFDNYGVTQVQPKNINIVKEELAKKFCSITLPKELDLRALTTKVNNQIKYRKQLELTNRERKNLPFILYRLDNNEPTIRVVINNMDFEHFSGFRRIIYAFFSGYKTESLITQILRDEIKRAIALYEFDLTRLRYLDQGRNQFLYEYGVKFLAKHLINGIKPYLESISFPSGLHNSGFVREAIVSLFESKDIYLKDKIRCFREIGDTNVYDSLYQDIASALIPEVDENGTQEYKDMLKNQLYKVLGDPRYSRTSYKWNGVKPRARQIFLTWLNKDALELFFEIILDNARGTVKESAVKYRLAFWKAYLPNMSSTWVLLGSDARIRAIRLTQNKMLGYGHINSSETCVFMFSIGGFTFVEMDYGALRIWENGKCPVSFGQKYAFLYDIKSEHSLLEKFIHASPSTYNWQNKVGDWLSYNCRVTKTANDWRP